MLAASVYLGGWILVTSLCILLSEWIRERFMRAPSHLGLTAVLAGALWPVLAVGLAQFAFIAAAVRLLTRRPVPPPPPRHLAHNAGRNTSQTVPSDEVAQPSEA